MCRVNDFNLSYESLTGPEAWKILHSLPETDPAFFAELTQPQSRVSAPVLTLDEACDEDVEVSELDNPGDDSVVPLKAVLGMVQGSMEDDDCFVPGDDWGFVSVAEAEATLVEVVDGVKIDTTDAVRCPKGRGQWKQCQNKLYSYEEWVLAR